MTHNFLFHIQSVAPSILPPVTTWMIWAVLKTFPEVPSLCVVISPTVRGRGRGGQGRTRRRESQNSNSPEGVGGKQAHQATPSQHWTLPLCAVESLPVDVSPCRSKWRMSWHITSRSALQRVAWLAARLFYTFLTDRLHVPPEAVRSESAKRWAARGLGGGQWLTRPHSSIHTRENPHTCIRSVNQCLHPHMQGSIQMHRKEDKSTYIHT